MANELETLRAALQEARDALAQEINISKAACALADRYRHERDAARGETGAAKSRLADAALHGDDLQSAIKSALAGSALVNTREGLAIVSEFGKARATVKSASTTPLTDLGAIHKVLRTGKPVVLGNGDGSV
jgi:hypothetical protein